MTSNFFVGLHRLGNSIYINPIPNGKLFKGISVRFSFDGVYKLLDTEIISFTNKIVHIESILGNSSRMLMDRISKTVNIGEIECLLNQFFIALLNTKKKLF